MNAMLKVGFKESVGKFWKLVFLHSFAFYVFYTNKLYIIDNMTYDKMEKSSCLILEENVENNLQYYLSSGIVE